MGNLIADEMSHMFARRILTATALFLRNKAFIQIERREVDAARTLKSSSGVLVVDQHVSDHVSP